MERHVLGCQWERRFFFEVPRTKTFHPQIPTFLLSLLATNSIVALVDQSDTILPLQWDMKGCEDTKLVRKEIRNLQELQGEPRSPLDHEGPTVELARL